MHQELLTLVGPILFGVLSLRAQDEDDYADDDEEEEEEQEDDDEEKDDEEDADAGGERLPRLITFKILRYALIPYDQTDAWERPLPEPKGRAIEVALPLRETHPRLFQYRNRDHALVGFSSLAEGNRFLFGRLAKKREIAIGQLRQHDVVEITTDDWLPIWILFDTVDQYMAVEMHSRFGRLDHVIQVLQTALTESVEREHRHEVIVSPVTDARAFWEIVERAPRIFRARLRFVSPNFLDTPGQFRELLGRWRNLFNQTEAEVNLNNDEGNLSLPTQVLREPIEYIAAGEGDWKLTVEDEGQRRSMSSKDSSESLRLRFPRASHPQDEIEQAESMASRLADALSKLLGQRRDNP